MWNLKYDTNESIYKTDLLIVNRPVVAKGERGRGMNKEFGVGRYKLLHLEWRNIEVLMYTAQVTIFNTP